MKRLLKIIAIIVVVIVIIVAIVGFMTSGQRDIARNFALDASAGNVDAAMANLHEGLISEMPEGQLKNAFANAEPYTDVSFSSVQASGGRTQLEGTATTAGGCSSQVSFTVLDNKIISFNIEPLCPKK